MKIIKTHLLDASALVKLVVDEDGSEAVKSYFGKNSVFWTTAFCLAEALGVLKVKYYYRNELTQEAYFSGSKELLAYLRNGSISFEEINVTDISIINEAERLSKHYSIDLIDVFQIVTLMKGFPSRLEGDSKTILITGDSKLSTVARKEGLRVWNCIKDNEPS